MYAMKSIQNYINFDSNMLFDDIYIEIPSNEVFFISQTKNNYDYSNVILNQEQIVKFQKKLLSNNWFNFFLNHVNDIKSWIDFEQKIEQALIHSINAINIINEKHLKEKSFNIPIFNRPLDNNTSYFFTDLQFNILSCFEFIIIDPVTFASDTRRANLNSKFFTSKDIDIYGFDSNEFFNFLQNQLEDFIEIFNLYLTLIIDKLEPRVKFNLNILNSIEKVFSFNYTNTFTKFYKNDIDIEYLHGKSGLDQNLVLGISDLKNESLKNLKAYGFTKYHQKILKNTQYYFLKEDIKNNKKNLIELEEAKIMIRASVNNNAYIQHYNKLYKKIEDKIKSKDINFIIWGHSLDVSDEVYINEIFSFNEVIDNNVRVIIYHYNTKAKSDLLTNLFHILGKDKVELWVKEKWLVFQQNPSIEAQSELAAS